MIAGRKRYYLPDHPLADRHGVVFGSRAVLWERLGGHDGTCNWCGAEVRWADRTLLADHLSGDVSDDSPSNIVPACRGCNANREDGTNKGRRPRLACAACGDTFLPHHPPQRYCTRQCASTRSIGVPRGSKALHGTRSRYTYGCRCQSCRAVERERGKRRRVAGSDVERWAAIPRPGGRPRKER